MSVNPEISHDTDPGFTPPEKPDNDTEPGENTVVDFRPSAQEIPSNKKTSISRTEVIDALIDSAREAAQENDLFVEKKTYEAARNHLKNELANLDEKLAAAEKNGDVESALAIRKQKLNLEAKRNLVDIELESIVETSAKIQETTQRLTAEQTEEAYESAETQQIILLDQPKNRPQPAEPPSPLGWAGRTFERGKKLIGKIFGTRG